VPVATMLENPGSYWKGCTCHNSQEKLDENKDLQNKTVFLKEV